MQEDHRHQLADASPNFGFLKGFSTSLIQAAVAAERYILKDPVTALMRLRQFGELLAQEAAATVGLFTDPTDSQLDLLRRLADRQALPRDVAELFHDLRRKGNDAIHSGAGSRSEALHQLRMARTLGVWFVRGFGKKPNLKVGKFVPPPDLDGNDEALRGELERLRQEVADATAKAHSATEDAQLEAQLRIEAEANQKRAYADLETALELAQQTEEQAAAEKAASQAELAEHLQQLQATGAKAAKGDIEQVVVQAQKAGTPDQLDLDEAATRRLIDAQLQAAGWEADTERQTFASGVRPTKGRNLAIAEWPTESGPADYVLFVGLTAMAVVEAKRKRKDVAGAIDQAKRYSRDYQQRAGDMPGGPWADFKVPFLFATNGRPYLRQIRSKSGIWFLDGRRSTNHPDALEGWYTPEGLRALLAQDHAAAEKVLEHEPTDYLGLREYQVDAIRAAEHAVAEGRRELLLAMATGTGKTRTALGLIYRFLKARRFRRVLFLVDRTSLGEQAEGAFKNVKLESQKTLDKIYDVRGNDDLVVDADTRLHIATVQGMVRNVLFAGDDKPPVPVDRYDCIIVDESHRGYNLDRDMSEGELQFRSERDYVSSYRRVLDHFDAVRIGLTATPALHTTEIFGKPAFEYTYRQAVIDGFLVDHEPPIRIRTELNTSGIHWQVGEEVAVYRGGNDQLELFNTPDEIDIEVEGFNTKVVTENFNRVVCDALAEEIDPSLPGKTLIFCATDSHADMVVTLLKEAFARVYGEVEDDAVMKITGAADKPRKKIRLFKNESLPKVAVTVDLLSTGIDVPEITSVVFLRRVRSRILYEQMLGRATRLCPEIGKEFFRVYDPIDLYAALQDYSTMKPVVTRPSFTFEQLAQELVKVSDESYCEDVAEEFLVKFHRRKSRLEGEAQAEFSVAAGMDPGDFASLLRRKDASELRRFFSEQPRVAAYLDGLRSSEQKPLLVSPHDDKLLGTERGYGTATKPEDYLDGFKSYLQEHRNELPALMVVMQRPRELTRKQLKELRLALDQAGYSESHLRTAWSETTNQDIAASIVGFIRNQSLGSPLVSFQERVDRAVAKILASQSWTTPQRQWLERIGKQLGKETIVDRAALDRGQFKAKGGFSRIDRVFGGRLEAVLGDLHEQLWTDAG